MTDTSALLRMDDEALLRLDAEAQIRLKAAVLGMANKDGDEILATLRGRLPASTHEIELIERSGRATVRGANHMAFALMAMMLWVGIVAIWGTGIDPLTHATMAFAAFSVVLYCALTARWSFADAKLMDAIMEARDFAESVGILHGLGRAAIYSARIGANEVIRTSMPLEPDMRMRIVRSGSRSKLVVERSPGQARLNIAGVDPKEAQAFMDAHGASKE